MILNGRASWYSSEDPGGNPYLAFQSVRVCQSCIGIGCKRCHKDGWLTNLMPFNKMGMECAMPESLIEEHGLTPGQLIMVSLKRTGLPLMTRQKSIVVRLLDKGPAEKLYREQNRIIDLTEFAFGLLEDCRTGIIDVEVEPL